LKKSGAKTFVGFGLWLLKQHGSKRAKIFAPLF
jgi:hypothetical protein